MKSGAAPLLLAAVCAAQAPPDWLLDPSSYRARIDVNGHELVLDNGLLRLVVRLDKGPSLVSLEQRTAGQQLLRAAAPLGAFVCNGEEVRVGGASPQPNRAFLLPGWIEALQPDPTAFAPCGEVRIGPIAERFAWRRTRAASPDAV
ncbi:MAG TPA: hypothetical protein VFT55_06710, partial [Planctomycetota bacterium]|nr:hypothetical protein [Planctomycetota bacterium]